MHPRVAPAHEAVAPDCYAALAATVSPYDAEADRALFDAIIAGDARLADSVYRRLVPPIESALQRLLGGRRHDHTQLVERSLKRVIFEISRHPQPWVCSLTTWAHARAAQIALDVLRGSDGPSVAPSADEPIRPSLLEAAPYRGIEQLRALLSELAAPQAEVVVLHHLLGLALSHVAITTGASLEAVQHRLAHGRQKLAARLQERGAAPAGVMQPA